MDIALAPGTFAVSGNRRHAALVLRNLPLIDSFVFLGPNSTPATMDLWVRWKATGPVRERGSGTDVPATDPAAFRGRFSRAEAVGAFSGVETGFSFQTDGKATTRRTFAELGTERNGSFL